LSPRSALLVAAALAATSMVQPATQHALAQANPGLNGKIVFASDRDGNSEIYVMKSDGTDQTRLTYTKAWEFEPAWSPDGTRIAFAGDRGESFDIYVMEANRSGVTRLTTNTAFETSPSWSPDGTRIAFDRCEEFQCSIQVIDLITGSTTQIASGYEPAWSPDGAAIVYQYGAIFLVSAEGEFIRKVRDIHSGEHVDEPVWAPGGGKIVYAMDQTDGFGAWKLWLIRPDGTDDHQIEAVPGKIATTTPTWSPDGSRIAFSGGDPFGQHADIFVIQPYNGSIVKLTEDSRRNIDPDWQPLCTIQGTDGPDTLVGTTGRDVICGAGGDDTIYGLGGKDVIFGGAGNDLIDAGDGQDVLVGGLGSDRLLGGTGDDFIGATDGSGEDHLHGATGADRCWSDPGDVLRDCELG
jgi:Tol biopolymer transport system component